MATRTMNLGGGFGLKYPSRYAFDGAELGLEYDGTLELDEEGGRLVCRSLTLSQRDGGQPVTANGVKSIPIVRLIAFASAQPTFPSADNVMQRRGSGWGPVRWDELSELEHVALAYRVGYARGEHPTKAVAVSLEISEAVAAKRVQAARRAGLLDPTSPGRKGT